MGRDHVEKDGSVIIWVPTKERLKRKGSIDEKKLVGISEGVYKIGVKVRGKNTKVGRGIHTKGSRVMQLGLPGSI